MFEHWSYFGYTLMFCLPPLLLLWLRREFARRMRPELGRITAATAILTLYGCATWPVALRMGAWAYADERILGVRLFGWVHIEDAVWWLLISFLFASFLSLSIRCEEEGVDIFSSEVRGLLRSFRHAFQGFRIVRLERNSTIHAAAAAFVILEAVFLEVSALEWLALLLAIGSVLGMELFNSVLERLASRLACGQDEEIRLVKDAAAAGVLLASIIASIVGMTVFLPRILPAIL